MVKKISISIPDDLFKVLEEAARREGISKSKLITEALKAYFRLEEPSGEYPTVLWKLKASGALRLRSPRRVGRRVKGGWVVEEF